MAQAATRGRSRRKGLLNIIPGGRCWLCGQSVNRKLPPEHPAAPSADHVRPLSLGGTHTRRNLRLAHAFCNRYRGNAEPVVDDDYRAALRPLLRAEVNAWLLKWAMNGGRG